MRRFAMITAVIAVSLVTVPALATKVMGKIIVTQEFREALAAAEKPEEQQRQQGYWNLPNGIIPVLPPLVDPSRDLGVVVFKEGAEPPEPDKLTTVKVRTAGLERNVVVTRPKSTIRLRSVDPFDHELYSPEIDGFRPERQSQNAFRPVEFPAEGVYHIRCRLMPHFDALVVVTPAHFVLEVDDKGDFTLAEMEPGSYTLKVFHGGKWVFEQKFEIKDDKQKELRLEVKLSGPTPAKGPEQKADEKDAKQADEGQAKKKGK